jgi:hypothetical protein
MNLRHEAWAGARVDEFLVDGPGPNAVANPFWAQGQVSGAALYKPDITLLLIGSNDAHQISPQSILGTLLSEYWTQGPAYPGFVAAYTNLVNRIYADAPKTYVIISSLPPIDPSSAVGYGAVHVAELNVLIRQIAQDFIGA